MPSKVKKNINSKEIEALLTPKDEDLIYEEDLIRNPYVLKSWIRYIDFKADSPLQQNILYERALKELPGSYKLWYAYLKQRVSQVRGRVITDPAFEAVNNTFERCLVYLSKMPRIWLEYCEFLMGQMLITRTRQAFDRALRSLAVGQHERIWKLYIKFVKHNHVPTATAIRVQKRYLKFNEAYIEDFVDYLTSVGEWDMAAELLVRIVNNEKFKSTKNKTKQQLWLQLCDIISKHSDKIKSIKVDKIVRGGLNKFSEDVGKLWTTLADYHIRLAHFDKARDIFEEGMNSVITVKDFAQIWDGSVQFEDTLIKSQVETMERDGAQQDEQEMLDFDLRIARYEDLIARQPLLVNSVLLRQNPHNVHEWQKRATLYEDPTQVVETYLEALDTIDPQKAKGRMQILWTNFAQFYEKRGSIQDARRIFEKAVKADFKYVEDLATVWCEYAEMEVRNGNLQEARAVLERATTQAKDVPKALDGKDPIQRRVFRNAKLWAFYADVEESMGTFHTTKAVYDRMLELKAATPQVIINYASWLEENKYFEESFKAYEKGIAMFTFPHVFDVWVSYLTKFIERYGGRKLERARELFEQVLESVPAKSAKVFFVMYANLEEEFGLARHAMRVYERATRAVADEDKFAMYSLYINRATEFFGVARTREIYERAIETLPDKQAKDMCLRYAELEKRLGEIDRARAVFVHASQFCDPRIETAFWQRFREFEVEHGNQDTFREMLRIKRSVQAQYATQVTIMTPEQLAAQPPSINRVETQFEALEREAQGQEVLPPKVQPLIQFTAGGTMGNVPAPKAPAPVNPEEISLEEEEEEEGPQVELEQLQVPQSVFERNVKSGKAEDGGKKGALERMREKRKRE